MGDDSWCHQLFLLAPLTFQLQKNLETMGPAVKIDEHLLRLQKFSATNDHHHRNGRKNKTLWRSIWIQNLVAVVSGDMLFVSKASLFHQWWQGVKPPWCFVNCEVAVEPGVNPFLKKYIYILPNTYVELKNRVEFQDHPMVFQFLRRFFPVSLGDSVGFCGDWECLEALFPHRHPSY